ncbi:hypothetical protein MP228_005683 [Amoeboaphelidium protococcarum]|nr:hypothetical protein MP228_005683 [Amoeboaphelidium protococcarum]
MLHWPLKQSVSGLGYRLWSVCIQLRSLLTLSIITLNGFVPWLVLLVVCFCCKYLQLLVSNDYLFTSPGILGVCGLSRRSALLRCAQSLLLLSLGASCTVQVIKGLIAVQIRIAPVLRPYTAADQVSLLLRCPWYPHHLWLPTFFCDLLQYVGVNPLVLLTQYVGYNPFSM